MRVVIAEDSILLRDGLRRLFASRDVDVVAAVGDAPALLAAVEQHRPDLLIADVRMPPSFTDEGLRAALEVSVRWPEVGVPVLSQYVEERYAAKLLAGRTSRIGYLLKDRVRSSRNCWCAAAHQARPRAPADSGHRRYSRYCAT